VSAERKTNREYALLLEERVEMMISVLNVLVEGYMWAQRVQIEDAYDRAAVVLATCRCLYSEDVNRAVRK